MNKKAYTTPEVEIEIFDCTVYTDAIATSDGGLDPNDQEIIF